jgi:hypothetical protein
MRTSPTLPYSHTPILALLAILASAVVCGPAQAADVQVMLADGRTLDKVTLKPGAAPRQVTIEQRGQAPLTVAPEELLVVDYGKVAGREATPSVRLSNGDQVVGKVTFPSARQVKVAAGWGSLTVPLAWCAAIRLNEKAGLPGPVTKDAILVANDRVEGEIQGVAAGKVNIDLGTGKPVPVDLAKVQAIAIAPRSRPTDPPAGLLLGIDLGGGEKLTGRWVSLDQDILQVKLDWGETLDIPVASISRLEVKNGKLVYLSALKPTEVRQIPYLDGSYPYRVDRAVSGRPMRLGGKSYSRGIGAHSKTELTYALDGGYQSFAATIGIDDAVGGGGSVVFRVFGDEKLLHESPVMRGGDVPVDLKIPLKGVLLLRIEVDYADEGDVADHADWADARLLRQ